MDCQRVGVPFRRWIERIRDAGSACPHSQWSSSLEKRVKQVAPGTVNEDIAALKKMFSFALEEEVIDQHPIGRFPKLKVQERARSVIRLRDQVASNTDASHRLSIRVHQPVDEQAVGQP